MSERAVRVFVADDHPPYRDGISRAISEREGLELAGEADTGLAEKIAAIERELPQPKEVLAIADGTGENEHILIRGNPHSKGEVTPRRMPVAIFGETQPVLRPEDATGNELKPEGGSG